MEIHKLLLRQLNRAQLKIDQLPNSLQTWNEFIEHINQTYLENDQHRYLLERSMKISSWEMENLNIKLEDAQHIAGMGYWYYDINNQTTIWSKELYNLLGVNKPLLFDEFVQLVHEDDKIILNAVVQNALTNKTDFKCEMRIKIPKRDYKWFRSIGRYKGDNIVTGVLIDINEHKISEAQIQELTHQLISAAHRAGMSEVATSILHNIGNILNSSNISSEIIIENLNKQYYKKLFKAVLMLKNNLSDVHHFLTADAAGKVLPNYLVDLVGLIEKEYEQTLDEADNVFNSLIQIKEIVAMQQVFISVPQTAEQVFIPDLVDKALQITLNNARDNGINVEKIYQIYPVVTTFKSKLLQIIINLLQNAKDSLHENNDNKFKQITIIIKKNSVDKIEIIIKDNGIGIPQEHLNRIFALGFTTKENGHGYGLQSSAIAARELGGTLQAQSEGVEKGASFTLVLPLENEEQKPIE